MLKIKSVIKKYDNSSKEILNISEFCISSSSMVRICGENGIGKTTLLNILAGITSFEGDLIYDNISCKESYEEYLKLVYLVGNDMFLYDFLTGKEMIDFVKELLSDEVNRCYVDKFIQNSGLHKYLDTFTKDMSLGTKQKLSIVLSLLCCPKILLLDEPFVNLDDESKVALADALQYLVKKYNSIVIFTTHSKEKSIERLATHTAFLVSSDTEGANLNWGVPK